MKDFSIQSQKELRTKLEKIEGLLHDQHLKEALAEIRDFESSQKIEQIPSQDQSHFYYLKARVLRSLGNCDEALECGEKAFSLIKDTTNHKRIAQVQHALGMIHVSLGNLKEAEIEIRDALTGFRRVSDFTGMITALSKLAFIESLKGNYDRSVELLQDALNYCDQANDKRNRRILYGNLGARYTLMGRWEEAERNLRLNVELNGECQDHVNLCRGLLSLGYVNSLQRDLKEAEKHYQEAVKIIYETNATHELAIYHEYSGELEFVQGNHQNAKQHYLDAIRIGEQTAPDSAIISQAYRLLAELHIAQKQYDEALSSCERALKVATSLGERIEIGAIHRALGQIYTAKNEKEKAKENFEKSISILEEIGAKFELGKAYLEAGKSTCFEYFANLKFLGKAEDLFRELGSRYYIGLVNLSLANLLFSNNEPQKALLFLDSAEKIFKELSEEKELKEVTALKNKFSFIALASSFPQKISFSDIITQNPAMLSVIHKATQIKDTTHTILLEGETGTGKDLLARAIHFESQFKDNPFVPVNCAAIPKELVESELFGYKKGAFTGASTDKKGLIEEAEQGTLFLNEIADLPLLIQAKLLGAIEDKQITRLGDTKPRRVDFRVIAASNKDLEKEVSSGNFREDLYYRLSVIKLSLPPLRERKEDIPLLVDHFLTKHFNDEGKEDLDIYSQILNMFDGYPWPGNVRELENQFIRYTSIPELIEGLSQRDKMANKATCGKLVEMEKIEILQAIKSSQDKNEAAKLLGISLATLYRKIKFYELNV